MPTRLGGGRPLDQFDLVNDEDPRPLNGKGKTPKTRMTMQSEEC
jgi:hypothetical protein